MWDWIPRRQGRAKRSVSRLCGSSLLTIERRSVMPESTGADLRIGPFMVGTRSATPAGRANGAGHLAWRMILIVTPPRRLPNAFRTDATERSAIKDRAASLAFNLSSSYSLIRLRGRILNIKRPARVQLWHSGWSKKIGRWRGKGNFGGAEGGFAGLRPLARRAMMKRGRNSGEKNIGICGTQAGFVSGFGGFSEGYFT